jgi:hypothetical protein
MPLKKKKAAASRKKTAAKSSSRSNAASQEVLEGIDDIDYEGLAQDFNKNKSSGGFFKMEQSELVFRPIPFQSEPEGRAKLFAVERRHFQVHPNHIVLPCLEHGCPICALVNEADDKEVQRKLRSSQKFLVNFVDRSIDDPFIQVWRMPFGVWNDMMDVILDRKNYPNALSLTMGFDFIAKKKGSGFQTRYSCNVAPNRTKVTFTGTPRDCDKLAEFRGDGVDLTKAALEVREHWEL